MQPTRNVAVQAFRALFVGGIAFVADAGVLWLISLTGLHYLVCAGLSFVVGVTVNYILSTRFVFKEKPAVKKSAEVMVYMAVSLVGLALTEGLMWFFTEIADLHFMVSKGVAAILTYAWNFTSRKIILYSKRSP
ncbi:MAG: GtrA family protein [Oscillospiraceae bacterium]|nr:GtrA family protein [Oscillospiraceae bacterium]